MSLIRVSVQHPLCVTSGAPIQRGGGWGPFVESFLRMNHGALTKLDVSPQIRSAEGGVQLILCPGGHAGAVPLRSAQTGHVAGGFLVEPRFGWVAVPILRPGPR